MLRAGSVKIGLLVLSSKKGKMENHWHLVEPKETTWVLSVPFFVYNKIATKWSGIADHCGYVSMTDTDKATCAHFTLLGHSLADLRVCQGINRKKIKTSIWGGRFFPTKTDCIWLLYVYNFDSKTCSILFNLYYKSVNTFRDYLHTWFGKKPCCGLCNIYCESQEHALVCDQGAHKKLAKGFWQLSRSRGLNDLGPDCYDVFSPW